MEIISSHARGETVNDTVRSFNYNIGNESFSITFDADFVASNSINGTVNGESIQQVTFSSDQGTTLHNLAESIENNQYVKEVQVHAPARRLIVIGNNDLELTLASFAVTGGASQANTTIVQKESLRDVHAIVTNDVRANGGKKKTFINPAQAQVQDVTAVADVSGSLNDTWFKLDASDGTLYYVWFNVSSGGTDPAVTGRTGVEIAISTGDTANTVAGAIQTAVDALAKFSATASSAVVTITDAANGEADAAIDSEAAPTGFTFEVTAYGAGTYTFDDAYAIQYLQETVVATVKFDEQVEGGTDSYANTYAEGTVHLLDITSISLTSGLAVIHRL